MSHPLDDVDASEQDLMAGAAAALDALRRSRSECPSVQVLRASALGGLTEDAQAAVTEHRQRCASCERLHTDLADLPPVSEMAAVEGRRVWDTISGRLGVEQPHRRGFAWPATWLSRLAYATAALLVVAVAVSGWLWVSHDEPLSPSMPLAARLPARQPAAALGSEAEPLSPRQFATVLDKPPVKLTLATITWRGSERGNADLLEEIAPALDDFRADRFADAAARFEALAAKYPGSVEIPFYLGVSRLFLSQPNEAAIALRSALRLADDSFRDDARWYFALALERSGLASVARTEYVALCGTKGEYKARACDALAALDKRVTTPLR